MKNAVIVTVAASLVLRGATLALGAGLVPKGVFTLEREIFEESRGELTEWALIQLLPLSKTRFLALAEVRVFRRPAEVGKPQGDPPVVREGLPRILQEGHVLAIVTKEGRVVAQSELVPHLRGGGAVADAPRWTRALAMEDNPRCPYAMLRHDREELWCFDYQLAKGPVYPLPLGSIEGAVPVVTASGYEVWIFGQERTGEASSEPPNLWSDLTRAPRIPSTLGLRLATDTGELYELPIGGQKLAGAVRQAAQSWFAARKGWRLSGVRLRPGMVADPVHVANGVPVLIQACFQGPGEIGEEGTSWLFFDAQVGEGGLQNLRQIAFSVELESGRPKAELNPKEMVLRVPAASALRWFYRAPLPGQRFILGLSVISAPQGREMAEQKGYKVVFYMLLVGPSGVEVVSIPKFQTQAQEKLSTTDTWVSVRPWEILGFRPSGELLLGTDCISTRTKELTQPCGVWAELIP